MSRHTVKRHYRFKRHNPRSYFYYPNGFMGFDFAGQWWPAPGRAGRKLQGAAI